MKKILSMLLAVCLCVGCLPLSAGASGNLSLEDQEALKKFLTQFAISGLNEFNYEKASDCIETPYGRQNTILTSLVTNLVVSACDFSVYPGERPEEHWHEPDPLGMFAIPAYGKFPISTVDWVLSNIFNCSQKHIDNMKESFARINRHVYILGKYYYVSIAGVGTGTSIEITKMKSIGQKYQVIYNVRNYSSPPEKHYAIVELKNIDGKKYWSLYANTRLQNNTDPIALGGFVDVAINSYYATPVLWAVEKKITSGTSATKFSPNNGCTRAQAVAFLWRAAGEPEPQGAEMSFTDVKVGDYYEKAVRWAVENNITAGTSATRFSPNSTCTRAQIVTFLWRMKGAPAVGGVSPFLDVPPSLYYAGAVAWAVENGITEGTSANYFSPHNDCSRGQIVTFLYRGK